MMKERGKGIETIHDQGQNGEFRDKRRNYANTKTTI
jgi:hypothetical protein